MNDAPPEFLEDQLQRARSGDRPAFAALIRTHQRSVYSLALRMLGTRDLAEDLTQDVFMQLHSHLQGIKSSGHLAFWLRQVAARRAIDQLRRRARLEMTPLEDAPPLFSAADGADPLLQRHLQGLLSEMSPAARAVLLLRYQEDLDPMDIARTLEMPIDTVKSHLKRSLDLLRRNTPGAAPACREDEST